MHPFENTEVAFVTRSDRSLQKAGLLFRIMSRPLLVSLSGWIIATAVRFRLPVKWLVKPTLFSLFCGGENINESEKVISTLSRYGIKSVLDFAAENQHLEEEINAVKQEIIKTMELAAGNNNVPFSVFKPTALAPAGVLSDYVAGDENSPAMERFRENVRTLCREAYERRIRIMIDAEEYHYQHIVDDLAMEMMEKYNREEAIVFNTLQMYRHDRLEFLDESVSRARNKNFKLGIKLVRGAYLDQERERAAGLGYPSPLFPDKESTDRAFNEAVKVCLENIDITSLFAGTHNEQSMVLLMEIMKKKGLAPNDERVFVSQLYGMSDHISFNMAKLSYNVAKYLPYGPVQYLVPYLIRRAEENRSVTGQSGRELYFVLKEQKRRREAKRLARKNQKLTD